MPDGLAYVATANEVWVTTPRDRTIRILDASTLAQKEKLTFDGNPEGFAVDLTTRALLHEHGGQGPHARDRPQVAQDRRDLETGVRRGRAAWAQDRGEERIPARRLQHEDGGARCRPSGAVLSAIDTGDGVDDLDYAPSARLVYVGAAKAGELTVARLDAAGKLSLVAKVPTRVGARNGVVATDGTVFLGHSGLARLSDLVVATPKK